MSDLTAMLHAHPAPAKSNGDAGHADAPTLQLQLQACLHACRTCADECEMHAREMDMEHCRICAEVCRRCAEACERMAAALVP